MKIADKTVVSLRYIMKDGNGEILENNMDSVPVKYVHGGGFILPQLESTLEGLEAGDTKKIVFTGNGNSNVDMSLHFDVVIDEVRHATTEEVQSRKPMKEEDCGPDCSCHD